MKKLVSLFVIAAMIFAATPNVFATTTINAAGNPNNTAASVADDVNFADNGTLTITGAAVSINTAGDPSASTEVVGNAVTATTTANGTITYTAAHTGASSIFGRIGINGSNEILAINLDGTGSLTLYGDAGINNGIIMSANSTLNLITGVDLTSTGSAVSNDSGAATGTVNLLGSSTITGTIGGAGVAALTAFSAGAVGSTSTLTAGLFATTTSISSTGTLNAAGITGTTVNFGGDGFLTTDTGTNITAAVTTSTNNTGTLTLEGTTIVSGAVGTATAVLKEINAGVAATTSTFSSNVFTTLLDVTGTGDVAFNGNFGSSSFATGVVDFEAAGGTATYADNMSHFGSYTTQNAGQGNLTFSGTSTVSGIVGSNANYLNTITANGAGETLTFGSNVFATDITQGAANTMNIGANTIDLNGTADGDFTLFAGGTLGLTLSGASAFGNILANGATGTAVVAASNILNVTLNYAVANGQTFAIITATDDGVAAVPGTITDNSAFFNFTATEPTTGDIVLTANSNAAAVAQTENASNVLTAVNSAIVSGASADFTTAISSLYAISGLQAASDAVETLDPDSTGGNVEGTQAVTDQFIGGVSNRLGFARSVLSQKGISTGDTFQGAGFWLQGLGSHGDQDARKGSAGYDYDAFGVALGADKLVSDHLRVGLAAGYGRTGINSKALGNAQTDVNSWSGSLYTSYDSAMMERDAEGAPSKVVSPEDDSFYVDNIAAFTYHDYNSSRNIALGGLNRTAEADFGGQQYSFKVETGYTIRTEATAALETTPFVSLGYSYLHMNSYTEEGAGALNLSVNGEGYHALDQALGMRFAYPMAFKDSDFVFIPAVKAAWLYDYIGDRVETKSTFAGGGSSFTTEGAKPAQSGFLVGAELALVNIGNLTLTVNWDMELRDEYLSNTYGGTARFEF